MGSFLRTTRFLLPTTLVVLAFVQVAIAAPAVSISEMTVNDPAGFGTIRGTVRDEAGGPIADATVAVFRIGTSQLLKQVSTAANGSFIAKVVPGKYSLLAVAEGFNPMTLAAVDVGRLGEFNFGFKLERAGSGNTLPEKRLDRNSSKWRIRAAAAQRSIYQNTDGDSPVDESETADSEPDSKLARPQAVVETYFASSKDGAYQGVNFATLIPVSPKADVSVIGQLARGQKAPQRVETSLVLRAVPDHDLKFTTSLARIGAIKTGDDEQTLGQISVQAIDEWKVRPGVILVLGFDYSKFTGAGDDSAITPRLGLQFDLNSRTRLRTAFAAQTEERTWGSAVDLEGMAVNFREPVSVDDIYVTGHKAKMNRSTRLEFGIERILDGRSSIEANVFFDMTMARGVGLNRLPFDAINDEAFDGLVANQQGRAAGIRMVYSRRLTETFNASVGYSYGTGQSLNAEGFTDPANLFRTALFQTAFSELDADFDSGTNIKTIFRLSSAATVFAIDPFKGRLAIYDPGLSVLVTQRLPRFGLPLKAQAVIDARNVFDFQTGGSGVDGSLKLDGRHRAFRGGILVRF